MHKKVSSFLEKHGIGVGDTVKLKFKGCEKTGIIMPKDRFSDPETIIIKLSNGYNIGINVHEIESADKIEKSEEIKALSAPSIRPDEKKPKVSIIITGGTISSKIDYRTGGVSGLSKPEEILYNIPELADISYIETRTPFSKMSEDMIYDDWIKIAKTVEKDLNNGFSGSIVAHGTDFLHYTASALSFMLKDFRKPIVLVGSQRSSDRASSDAGMNIICAARIATSDMGETGICMHSSTNDDYCIFIKGTRARKMHTSRRDAFRPVNDLPLAKVWPEGKIEKIKDDIKERSDESAKADTAFEPNIAILKTFPMADPSIIDFYIERGCKGFVVEGSGLGHVPTASKYSWVETIKKHAKDGVPFIVTSQTIYGRVHPSVYTNLRLLFHDAGAISGEDMLTETAFVKLGWVMGHTKDIDEIKSMMMTNIAGELSKRSLPGTYLY